MADSKDGPELHPVTVELAQGANYGAITTVLPSGDLQNQYIWVGTDGERVVVNTEVHRRKFKNIERDPRVTLTIRDEQNPYRYAEVRGEVVETVGGAGSPGPPRRTLAEVPRPTLRGREHSERAGDAVDRPRPADHPRVAGTGTYGLIAGATRNR